MRRLTKTGSSKLNADSQRLVSLALEMFYASSFLESEFCRKKLEVLVFRLLQARKQAVLNDAIEYLFTTDMEAYNCLLEVAEALSESAVIEEDGKKYQVLLVAVPVLAWTRFSIASGTLAPEQIEAISSRFARLILADDVRFAMAPGLYAVDQLPYSHVDVMAVTQGLVQSVVQGSRPNRRPFRFWRMGVISWQPLWPGKVRRFSAGSPYPIRPGSKRSGKNA